MTKLKTPRPRIVLEYWKPSKRFGTHKRRIVRSIEAARELAGRLVDDGYETQFFNEAGHADTSHL